MLVVAGANVLAVLAVLVVTWQLAADALEQYRPPADPLPPTCETSNPSLPFGRPDGIVIIIAAEILVLGLARNTKL